MLYISDEDHEAKAPLINVQSPSPPPEETINVELGSSETNHASRDSSNDVSPKTIHDHGTGYSYDLSDEKPVPPRHRWIVLFTLCLQNLAVWFSFDLMTVLQSEFMHHFALDNWQYNVAYSIIIVPCLLLTVLASKLIQRLNGVLYALLLSLLCILLAQTLMAVSCTIHVPSFALLVCARVVYGIGLSLNAISSFLIVHRYFDDHIASALAIAFSCVRVGFILNELVSVYVQHKFNSLPLTVWMTALIILLSFLFALYSLSVINNGCFYQVLRISPHNKHDSLRRYHGLDNDNNGGVDSNTAAYLYSFKIGFWLLLLVCGLGFTFFSAWNALAETVLQNRSELADAAQTRYYIYFFYILPCVLGPFYGVILDHNKAFFSTLVIGGVFGLVGHVLMTADWQWMPHSPLIALTLLCFGATFFNVAIWPSISFLIETNRLGFGYAVICAFYSICYTLSNLVMTRAYKSNVHGYLVVLCIIYCVIAIVLYLWKKDDEHRVKQYRYRLTPVNVPASNFSLLTIDEQCIDHDINENNEDENSADEEEDVEAIEGDGEHVTLMGGPGSKFLEKDGSDGDDNNECLNETMLGFVEEHEKIVFQIPSQYNLGDLL